MSMDKPMIGIVALARPTFDMEYAKEVAAQVKSNLDTLDATFVGDTQLLLDEAMVKEVLPKLQETKLDLLLVLQISFTDATMVVSLAKTIDAPLMMWSFPEPRIGGRLRLNSLCGINLAGHALGKAQQPFEYIHLAPNNPEAGEKIFSLAKAQQIAQQLQSTKLAVIGDHPAGFDTCEYNAQEIQKLCGAQVDAIQLPELFQRAKTISEEETETVYARVNSEVSNLSEVEQEPLRKSLKVFSALKQISQEQNYKGMAIRCWPEFFTEYGCAACGPMAMMNEDQVPSGCEADLYGTLSTLVLQWVGNAPAFMSDLVDVNTEDDTAVFWHCGLAPKSMADPEAEVRATIHTNRKKPLLYEFPLKPGRVTIARLSQSQNKTRLVLGSGEMLRAPMSFTGTSGVIRFDKPAQEVLGTIMEESLEHHFSLTYGEYRPTLRKLASLLNIPVLEIT